MGQSAGKGKIFGSVVDSETGQPIIGANVYLEDTSLGAASDLDGNFAIFNVPAENYTLVVSVVGYAETKISNLQVKNNEISKLDISIKPEILTTEVVVVEAKALQNTEASLLKSRQKSIAVSDAISAEEISRSGSGDAASAMTKVTGASVVGGKYVFIRGLGDRYSMTTLNGAELPSADPDKKSFQLDLIPANMLDNINTIKSFTPDKAGTFTGGLVDVSLKTYPEELTFQINSSVGYNSIATGNENFILGNSGKNDWLGMDDGTRELPDMLKNTTADMRVRRGMSLDEALWIDDISRSFNTAMIPVRSEAPVNSSFGISLGNTVYLNQSRNQSIGYFGSISWGQNYSFIENGETGRYKLVGGFNDAEALVPNFVGLDTRGTREIHWGSIANIAYRNARLGQIKFSYMHTQVSESEGRSLVGYRHTDRTAPGSTKEFSTNTVSWIERSLDTYQLDGEHLIPFLNNAALDWKISQSINEQLEPDQRFFFNVQIPQTDSTIIYQFDSANSIPISRYYRDLSEDNFSTQINLSLPFRQWNRQQSKVKLGFASTNVDRAYNQRRFDYVASTQLNVFSDGYTLDHEALFNAVGIIDSTTQPDRPDRWFRGGLYINEAIDSSYFFTGDMKTIAYYSMIDIPLFNRLRFIGGARYESTLMNSRTQKASDEPGRLDDQDILPSVNLIYGLQDNMNVRAAYSRTVARPTFRELAPYENFEFVGDFIFRGNANLKRTLITNYDLRWEWFLNPGEIIAISGFYKKFTNPIERKFIRIGGSGDDYKIGVENVSEGRVYGAELEIRKSFDFISDKLSDLKIGSNLTLVDSEVDLPQDDYELKLIAGDSSASKTRPFPGQSPYLFNINLTYDKYSSNTSFGIYYNIFGDRLFITGRDGTPDVFERGYGSLDVKASQGVFNSFIISFTARNLLNPAQEYSYTLKNKLVNKDFIYQSYKKGISYSLSITYKL
jgi:TonB-dependent receptor